MNKRIILTGATGYLGSHLAKALLAEGYDVVALKRKTSRLHRLESILPRLRFHDIEGLDFALLFQEMGNVDAVIHTATCYGRNGESASRISAANMQYPLSLLEAAVEAGVGTFINTDTSLDKHLNAYALSKKQFVDWGRYFAGRQKIRFLNARLEHFYGPGDDETKFTAHVIKSCLANAPELKLTLGEQRRDFIYIEDAVSAYLTVLEKKASLTDWFTQFDIGSGQAITIKEFVETVHRLANSTTKLAFGAIAYREGEVMSAQADTAFLRALGWRNTHILEQGLELILQGQP